MLRTALFVVQFRTSENLVFKSQAYLFIRVFIVYHNLFTVISWSEDHKNEQTVVLLLEF